LNIKKTSVTTTVVISVYKYKLLSSGFRRHIQDVFLIFNLLSEFHFVLILCFCDFILKDGHHCNWLQKKVHMYTVFLVCNSKNDTKNKINIIQELEEMLRLTSVIGQDEPIYLHAFGGRPPEPGKLCEGENKV